MGQYKVGFILVGGKYVTGIPSVQNGLIYEMIKQEPDFHGYALADNTFHLPLEQPFRVLDEMKISCMPYVGLLNDIDIIHSFQPPFNTVRTDAKRILTIHDLSPMLFPDWYNGEDGRRQFDVDIRQSAERADKIITVSEYTKKDVIKHFNIPENKIQVVYNGLNKSIFSGKIDIDIRKKFNIKGEYILSVCTLMKNKNLGSLIKAFKLYKERHSSSNVKLVLTGAKSNDGRLTEIVENLGWYKDDVIFTGFVSDEELGALYDNALAFTYVSFYEGFGLPILEALSMGKAVICSDTSSMPEVGGDAVCYCDPYEVESIAEAIQKVIEDENYRNELVKRSKIQAAKFSYKKAAKETLQIYHECLRR